MLFALIPFRVFHLKVATHPTYVFPLLVDDMLIIGLALDVVFIVL